jgi:hypothetical protein
MVVETMKTQNVSFFRPGGVFGIGLVAGLVAGFAVLLMSA